MRKQEIAIVLGFIAIMSAAVIFSRWRMFDYYHAPQCVRLYATDGRVAQQWTSDGPIITDDPNWRFLSGGRLVIVNGILSASPAPCAEAPA